MTYFCGPGSVCVSVSIVCHVLPRDPSGEFFFWRKVGARSPLVNSGPEKSCPRCDELCLLWVVRERRAPEPPPERSLLWAGRKVNTFAASVSVVCHILPRDPSGDFSVHSLFLLFPTSIPYSLFSIPYSSFPTSIPYSTAEIYRF